MKRLLAAIAIVALSLLLLPGVVAANPPPPSGGGGGGGGGASGPGSPEPLSALLLLAGAVPTYAIYRKTRSRAEQE